MVINPKEDFYELNPELAFKQPWIDIKKNFKNPSQMCWVLVMICDRRSEFYNEFFETRKKLIAEDYLEDPDYDYNELQSYIDSYDKLVITSRAERDVKVIEDKIEDRIMYIKDTEYNDKNAKTIDNIITSTPLLYDTVEKLKLMIDNKDNETQRRGGGEESLSEQNLI